MADGFMAKYNALMERERSAASRRDYNKVAEIKKGIQDLFARSPYTIGLVKVGAWTTSHHIVTDHGRQYALVDMTPYEVQREGEVYVLVKRT